MIKACLGKYANPKLAQSAKVAVLASVVDYLNGEEFVRIVTAPLNYKSPDFVSATEAELGAMGVAFSPTDSTSSPTTARQRQDRSYVQKHVLQELNASQNKDGQSLVLSHNICRSSA